MNFLTKARIEKEITLRELWKKTNIEICHLSSIERCKELPTQEEINKINKVLETDYQLDNFKIDESVIIFENNMKKAWTLVLDASKINKKGFVKCPVCKNKLFYIKHYNSHIWGRCESENCLYWMQ